MCTCLDICIHIYIALLIYKSLDHWNTRIYHIWLSYTCGWRRKGWGKTCDWQVSVFAGSNVSAVRLHFVKRCVYIEFLRHNFAYEYFKPKKNDKNCLLGTFRLFVIYVKKKGGILLNSVECCILLHPERNKNKLAERGTYI